MNESVPTKHKNCSHRTAAVPHLHALERSVELRRRTVHKHHLRSGS